jgi:hypothetical protein
MRQLLHFKTGQALVEFALAATLIFFLLAAAVDLGLIFFTIQGLHNAAQEGGTYGGRWLTTTTDAAGKQTRVLNMDAIRERVRKESGNRGGIGFVNLLDLNHNGIPDVGPANTSVVGAAGTTYEMVGANRVIDQYIQADMLQDTGNNGDPLDDLVGGQPTVCVDPSQVNRKCYIRVTVSAVYQPVFPLTPSFLKPTTLRSTFIIAVRDPFSQGGVASTPAVFQTTTPIPPTPTPVPLAITIQRYTKVNGTTSVPNQPVKISVKIQRAGINVTGASVTLVINGISYSLTELANGVYYNCSVGSFTGSASAPAGTVNAVAGTSAGSASASTTGTASAACP